MILPVVVFQDKFPSNNDIYFCLYRDYDQIVSPKSPQQIWILENPLAQRKPKCSYRQQESIMCTRVQYGKSQGNPPSAKRFQLAGLSVIIMDLVCNAVPPTR